MLAEATDEHMFADAARDGRLWVASAGDVPVGFALVIMLAHDLPHLEEMDVDPLTGAAVWARLSYARRASGQPSPDMTC